MKNLLLSAGRIVCFILLLCAVLLPSSSRAEQDLDGKIINSDSKEGIEGVSVKIEGSFQSTSTNKQGKFHFTGIRANSVRLILSHVSYEKDTLSVSLPSEELFLQLKPHSYLSKEVEISATRVEEGAAFAYSNISNEELESRNLGTDIPSLIQYYPSVAVTSDAGNGIGYSGLRIRGSDASRINVTLNGIPVNDAESHQVYWVDLPDLASSTESIQIQRGAGTSTNGSGAFGGSVNIQSLLLKPEAYATLNSSAGSFNTLKNTAAFGTGLIKNHFAVDGRLSLITSDGYIDRANSDLRSFYLSAAYYGKKSSLKILAFSGKEKTYQAWYGVNENVLDTARTFNEAGMYTDVNGNIRFYENQTDNYQQDNYQVHYTQSITSKWVMNLSLHGTKGKGYYEEYAANDAFSSYGLPDLIGPADTLSYSDMIRQRWLDNYFYGSVLSLRHETENSHFVFGAAANHYHGDHYGELIWTKDMPLTSFPLRYYSDDADKNELSVYMKYTFNLFKNVSLFLDAQSRTLTYDFEGPSSNGEMLPQSVRYSFFNPKAGVAYFLPSNQQVYISASVAQKEPVRDDFVSSSSASRPKPEKMIDYEAGYRFHNSKFHTAVNFYYMKYDDQLILTGKINDVGEYTRQNVKNSYRSGIEAEISYAPLNNLSIIANASSGNNKVRDYEEYIDDYDAGQQVLHTYHSSTLAFSPSLIASLRVKYELLQHLTAELMGKFTGEQYLDNTENENRKIAPYTTADFRLAYTLKTKYIPEIGLSLLVNNIFDKKYSSNGYTYSYIYGGELSTFNYYYPQAGINFLAGFQLSF